MDWIVYILIGILIIFGGYILVRIMFKAIFKSFYEKKNEYYNKQNKGGEANDKEKK